jgi:hypothetical protein
MLTHDIGPDSRGRHDELQRFNEARLEPTSGEPYSLAREVEGRSLEEEFLQHSRAQVARAASTVPTDAVGLIKWFQSLKETGPGQHDALFPWLEHESTLAQFRWFLRQEVAGEAGFEDLVALTQLKMPMRPKLELARNYWDEMGRGSESGMHGPMLARLTEELALDLSIEPVTESLALANLHAGQAFNRHNAYHAVGALGVIELTAPRRSHMVNRGLRRLGVSPHARQYYALHATLDVKHSEAWNREVIAPLVDGRPEVARAIAEGALMRLRAGARCFERYRLELGVCG